jgi:hypothetical protein
MAYKFVPFLHEKHEAWARVLLKMPPFAANTKGIVAEKDGTPVACMLADDWTFTSCMTHIGVEDAMVFKHGMHYEFADYMYNTCERKFLLGLVAADNLKALKLNKHFGYKEVYRIEDGHSEGVDFVLMRMDRDDCKYINRPKQKQAA